MDNKLKLDILIDQTINSFHALKRHCLVIIKECVNEIFASNSSIESLGWSQYTPYFNDGDTCHFSVHTDNIIINGRSIYEMNEEESSSQGYENIANKLSSCLDSIAYIDVGPLIFQELFNEGEVTFHKDGSYETSYVEHD